jgi:hypothetical protein
VDENLSVGGDHDNTFPPISMQTFFRLFRVQTRTLGKQPQRQLTKRSMASASAAAILYTAMVTESSSGPAPEDADTKRHHLKTGGFANPWE